MKPLYGLNIWIAFTGQALAHPGHGAGGGSHALQHYVSDPNHVVFWIVVFATILGVSALARRPAAALVRVWRNR